ncbi:MAG: hypothetical protein QHJ81_15075 [Anaerolineae bacterium]|nr:hypothetical protein [Anaerolineae bacterium]
MNRRWFVALLILLTAGLAACLPWQSPSEGQLVYAGPTEQGIAVGDFVPATDIQYVGMTEDGAEVLIGEQKAVKKKGDSLDWDGHPLPGVTLNLKQRIVWFTAEKMHVAGTARLAVDRPQPEAMPWPEELPALYKLPASYTVKRGEAIPGTTILYLGPTDDGAELGGIEGYPYRKIADSIAWTGSLADGVYLDTTLRVVLYNDEQLQVAGLATIGLMP